MTPHDPIRTPQAIVASLPLYRRLAAGWWGRHVCRLISRHSAPFRHFAAQAFVPGSIRNVIADDSNPDLIGFRFAVRNAWVDQQITGFAVWLDGRAVKPHRIFLDNGHGRFTAAEIARVRFEPGRPMTVTVLGRRLGDGVHFIALRLDGEVSPLHLSPVPILMHQDGGRLLFEAPRFPTSPKAAPTGPYVLHYAPLLLADFTWRFDPARRAELAGRHLREVVRLLAADPKATYAIAHEAVLDAAAALDETTRAQLAEFVAAGRLEPLLGGLVEPATGWIGGESLIRQFTSWQHDCRAILGRRSRTGWFPTDAAHPPSLPQILRKVGAGDILVAAGDARHDTPSAFMWEGIDGTRLRAHRLDFSPAAGYPLAAAAGPAGAQTAELVRRLSERAPTEHLFCPAGATFGRPQADLAAIMQALQPSARHYRVIPASPASFFARLPERGLPVATAQGQDQPAFDAARPAILRLHRRAEAALRQVEAMPPIVGVTPDAHWHAQFRRAERRLLACQDRRILAGAVRDDVVQSALHELRSVLDWADGASRDLAAQLARRIAAPADARGAVLVVNALSFWREEVIELSLMAQDGRLPVVFDGKFRLPAQLLEIHRFNDGSVKSARVAVRLAVPPFGYRSLWPMPPDFDAPSPPERGPVRVQGMRLTNGWITVELNPRNGAIAVLEDRDRGFVFRKGNAGLLTMRRCTRVKPGGGAGLGWVAKFRAERHEVICEGPLVAALRFHGRVGPHAASITYRLTQASKTLSVETTIEARADRGVFEVRVPLLADADRVVHALPYGMAARGRGSFAARQFVDIDPYKEGFAVLNDGIAAHRVDRRRLHLRLAADLNRIHELEGDSGVSLRGRHEFRYGVFPHAFDTGEAHVYRRGLAFNSPLLIHEQMQPPAVTADAAPRAKTLLRLRPDGIDVGSLFRREDGALVLRLVERTGRETDAALRPRWSYGRVVLADFEGRPLKEPDPARAGDGRSLTVRFRPFEIKTLVFDPPGAAN